jgi:HTH-type transcriptional regulator / antitoxin HigA
MSTTIALDTIYKSWDSFHATTHVEHIATVDQYNAMSQLADALVDDGAMDQAHARHSFFMLMSDLIQAYDQRHHPTPQVTGAALVRFLMDQHELRQADLPEVGPQSVVSEILSGRRELTLPHIRGLAKRFHLNPAAFL